MSWTLYILRCRDGTLYTGITTDVERRVTEHREGKASRYTRVRLPVTLVYREAVASRSVALRREAAVKRMSRRQKDRLVQAGLPSG
jgi:putative endonuclease